MVRTLLPTIIPPSYRGATIRYLYYVRCTLSGQYLNLENGPSHGGSIRDLSELESRIPFQVWVSQENNGLQSEEACNDGILFVTCPLEFVDEINSLCYCYGILILFPFFPLSSLIMPIFLNDLSGMY
ncbi:uncharacterized protein LOC111409121 isoform X2 [Olea europaea var. sylvestris]|nr:uncharacterized protein LOC111409121 isoform X2 [Olea europaea var. sylvestris]XP_022894841.1 uncharacterized protein LOC111409121 isoform X2 [Olea europaea var. sylvestris]XP_022894842.1 uncharacterized protein LOC111409121 isoform X2 [Olea europaea var. sylvestris]CAA2998829.1 Hypothetical predicted protein [Olea europaea subsp. europaea]